MYSFLTTVGCRNVGQTIIEWKASLLYIWRHQELRKGLCSINIYDSDKEEDIGNDYAVQVFFKKEVSVIREVLYVEVVAGFVFFIELAAALIVKAARRKRTGPCTSRNDVLLAVRFAVRWMLTIKLKKLRTPTWSLVCILRGKIGREVFPGSSIGLPSIRLTTKREPWWRKFEKLLLHATCIDFHW